MSIQPLFVLSARMMAGFAGGGYMPGLMTAGLSELRRSLDREAWLA